MRQDFVNAMIMRENGGISLAVSGREACRHTMKLSTLEYKKQVDFDTTYKISEEKLCINSRYYLIMKVLI